MTELQIYLSALLGGLHITALFCSGLFGVLGAGGALSPIDVAGPPEVLHSEGVELSAADSDFCFSCPDGPL